MDPGSGSSVVLRLQPAGGGTVRPVHQSDAGTNQTISSGTHTFADNNAMEARRFRLRFRARLRRRRTSMRLITTTRG
jgi:hypothetical protein